jgi:hypothetical protein
MQRTGTGQVISTAFRPTEDEAMSVCQFEARIAGVASRRMYIHIACIAKSLPWSLPHDHADVKSSTASLWCAKYDTSSEDRLMDGFAFGGEDAVDCRFQKEGPTPRKICTWTKIHHNHQPIEAEPFMIRASAVPIQSFSVDKHITGRERCGTRALKASADVI